MRIGIDASCWSNRRGFGRFTRELLTAIAALDTGDEFVLFVDRQTADRARLPDGWRVVTADTSAAPTQAAAADGRRSVGDLWRMRRIAAATPVDVIFFPAVYSYFPVGGDTPCVVTLHDVIAETLPHLVFQTRRSRLLWNIKCRLAVHRADRVMTVSQASKRGIMQYYGLAPDQVSVVTESASDAFFPVADDDPAHHAALGRYGLSPRARFLLYVGGISPHKNLDTLIGAFARLDMPVDADPLLLVLVGDYAGDVFRTCHGDLVARAERYGVADRVRFAGYVPDDDLRHLYAAAQAFVFPSYLEGFGLPAVEAMRCGAPVIVSDRGSLPEVVGEAGVLFDPHDAASLSDKVRQVVTDENYQKSLRVKSLDRGRDFSWAESARQTMELMRDVGGGR